MMPFPLFVFASSIIAVGTMSATLLLSRRRRLMIVATFTGAVALLILHGPVYFDYFADDAYITLRYSRHLADGLGPNWNSDGRVEGYTTFLWMALLAGVGKLGFELAAASRVFGFLALLATYFSVYRIWKLWADEEAESGVESPVLLAAVLLGLALTDGIPFWGFSGMETPLFMALLTGSAYLYFRERRGARFPWSAVTLAALAMTRPEGLIAAAVTGAFLAVEVVRGVDQRGALRRYLSWAGLFLLLYGSYFIWRYTYYDHLLPNTFYAKVEPSSGVFRLGLGYVVTSGLQYQLLAMFIGAVILLAAPRIRHDAAYIIAMGGFILLGVMLEGGDAFGYGRFIVPTLPLLYLAGLAGYAALLKRAALQPTHAVLVASLALSLGGLSLLSSSDFPPLALEREAHHERRMMGTWLNEHTPPDYTIAAFAVGAISYYGSDRDFLDLLGLNDVVIAHTDVPDFGGGFIGHERYNIDYVLDEVRPELIVPIEVSPEPLSEEELRLKFSDRGPVEARNALLHDPRLWERYEVRSVNIEDRWFNFFQRSDTVAELQAPGLR